MKYILPIFISIFISTLTSVSVVFAIPAATEFDCSPPATTDDATHLQSCGTLDVASIFRCGTHNTVQMICSTNRFNPCATHVCVLPIGKAGCNLDFHCEVGAICDGGTPAADPATGTCIRNPGDDISAGGSIGVTTSDIRNPIRSLVNILVGFLGALTVLIILWGAFEWIIARGNEEKIEKGKHMILWAAIGAIIISIAWTIASYVLQVGKDLG